MSRTLVLWCPDWPVVAAWLAGDLQSASGAGPAGRGTRAGGRPVAHSADFSLYQPVVVLAANRVVACSAAARAEGIYLGLRKREAQSRCPELLVVEHDEGRDARMFEAVVTTVEGIAPGVDVVRPGVCALAAAGPARYFGGEEHAAEHLVEQVAQACGVEAQVGVAYGVFAAGLAARDGRIISDRDTPAFLAGFDIAAIGSSIRSGAARASTGARNTSAKTVSGRDALVDLLRRLGVRTLGDFAALPAADILARFGFDASLVHRLAAGLDERPLAVRQLPPDLEVTETFDEPIDRIDAAAFAARALAQRLHERLAGFGLACTRLGIEAVTEHGEELHRVWRHDGLLTAAAIGDRVRWQLDGWLQHRPHRPAERRPTAGIVRLRLVPDGVIAHAGLQLGLWGDIGVERDRAHRAMTRVQGMLGPDAVVTAVPNGGRDPGDQIRLVPWGDERLPARPADQPWPGRLPPPAPATVLVEPMPVEVLDISGIRVGVTARLAVTAPLAMLVTSEPNQAEIVGWAGPWPVDERWWAPEEASRRARFQVALGDGRALLLCLAEGVWSVEAIYD
jgi:protein ImuB